jgi:flagellar basal body-associated protein FliL
MCRTATWFRTKRGGKKLKRKSAVLLLIIMLVLILTVAVPAGAQVVNTGNATNEQRVVQHFSKVHEIEFIGSRIGTN